MEKRTILITGASRGIGRAIACAFAEPGNRLVLNYRTNEKAAQETQEYVEEKGATSLLVCADVSEPEDVNRLFEEAEEAFGPVSILINNAGISSVNLIQDTTPAKWARLFATNSASVHWTTRRAIPSMISQKFGRIINIASIWGVVGASMESAYSASKGAVIAYTKACAKELIDSGITVNAIAPGVVDTDMMQEYDPETRREVLDLLPMGRMVHPMEIAYWVKAFAAPEAAAATGQVLTIDGGMR